MNDNYKFGIFIFFIFALIVIILYKSSLYENKELYDTMNTDVADIADIADVDAYVPPEFNHYYKNEIVHEKDEKPTKEDIMRYHEATNVYKKIFSDLLNSRELAHNYVIFTAPLKGHKFNNDDMHEILGYIKYNPQLFEDKMIYIGWIWNNTKFIINDYKVFKRYDEYQRYYQMPLESGEYKKLIDINNKEFELNDDILLSLHENHYKNEEAYVILNRLNNMFIHEKISNPKNFFCLNNTDKNPVLLRYYVMIRMGSDSPTYYISTNGGILSPSENISTIDQFKSNTDDKLNWEYLTIKIKNKLERLTTLIVREADESQMNESSIASYQIFTIDVVLKRVEYFNDNDIYEPYICKINSFPNKEYMVKQNDKMFVVYQDLAKNMIKMLGIK